MDERVGRQPVMLTQFEARTAFTVLLFVLNDPDWFQQGLFDGHEWRAIQRAAERLRSRVPDLAPDSVGTTGPEREVVRPSARAKAAADAWVNKMTGWHD